MMIYKQLPKIFPNETIKSFEKIDDDGICRQSCSEFDQAYLKWLDEGNTPEQADNV